MREDVTEPLLRSRRKPGPGSFDLTLNCLRRRSEKRAKSAESGNDRRCHRRQKALYGTVRRVTLLMSVQLPPTGLVDG